MTPLYKPYLGEFIGRQNFPQLLNDYFSKKLLEVFKDNYPRTPEKQKEKNALCYFLGAYPNLIKNTKLVSERTLDIIKNFYQSNKFYTDQLLNNIIEREVVRRVEQEIRNPSNLLPYNNINPQTNSPPPPYSSVGGSLSKKRKQVHKNKSKKTKKH